jgi:sirohydrochlorin ferrochelatase
MAASESQPYEAAQLAIMRERVLFNELRFLHSLSAGPALRAALDALAGKGAARAPAEMDAAPVVTPAPKPVDLRAALGLG